MDKEKIKKINEKIMNVALLIETVKDACVSNYNYAYAHVLDVALNEQWDICDEIEFSDLA